MALQGLPERLRIVVILKDVEGFNYKEISGILSCPLGTVMSRLSRGRSLLKQALMDYHQSPGLKVEKN
jgi:RNA polymerase sigma-70 factor (ECF subfamily)